MQYNASDFRDSRVTGGAYVDVNTGAKLLTASFSRRLSDAVRLEFTGFTPLSQDYDDPVGFVTEDSFLEMSMTVFF